MTSLPYFLMLFRAGGLSLRLINGRRKVVRLSLFFVSVDNLIALLSIGVVFVFLDQQPISFWALGIDFPSSKGWLEACFYFYINSLLYHLVLHI